MTRTLNSERALYISTCYWTSKTKSILYSHDTHHKPLLPIDRWRSRSYRITVNSARGATFRVRAIAMRNRVDSYEICKESENLVKIELTSSNCWQNDESAARTRSGGGSIHSKLLTVKAAGPHHQTWQWLSQWLNAGGFSRQWNSKKNLCKLIKLVLVLGIKKIGKNFSVFQQAGRNKVRTCIVLSKELNLAMETQLAYAGNQVRWTVLSGTSHSGKGHNRDRMFAFPLLGNWAEGHLRDVAMF